jgi:hypothetical protein
VPATPTSTRAPWASPLGAPPGICYTPTFSCSKFLSNFFLVISPSFFKNNIRSRLNVKYGNLVQDCVEHIWTQRYIVLPGPVTSLTHNSNTHIYISFILGHLIPFVVLCCPWSPSNDGTKLFHDYRWIQRPQKRQVKRMEGN